MLLPIIALQTAAVMLLLLLVAQAAAAAATATAAAADEPMDVLRLRMFVDDLPDMPRIQGFRHLNGTPNPTPAFLKIYMYRKNWKFHSDLPPTSVFAYGTSKRSATVPGPTIEALHGVPTTVTWHNRLPSKHILPWDPTLPTAVPASGNGVPTVVHLHGGIDEPASDGNANAWFTRGFRETGPTWTKKSYLYHNQQQPGNLWYHDHAMGLTRVNLLAGLVGAYVIRDPTVEAPLGLPGTHEFDRPLMVFDRSFRADGSIYMNTTGNNPSIHPHWQPEYFGDAIVVNGKVWPRMMVRRRKYRFRIINASNARFFRFFFSNGLPFVHVASDSAYLRRPVAANSTLLAPSEIADVVVDFSASNTSEAVLANDAPYPYPTGDPVNRANSKVMKFVIKDQPEVDASRVPRRLLRYPSPRLSGASRARYVALYEYTTDADEPTHLFINAKSYDDPATETPKLGTTELWSVINLTEDNHPLHIHLGLFVVVDQTELVDTEGFLRCMTKMNDAIGCHVERHARGKKVAVPAHEKGWKNVFKMSPGMVTRILVRFSPIHSNASSYPFDASAEPGYVYHCHVLDHEDNVMMRPLKLIR